jgi:glycosyltransferase involved in cell wall biosynthesis
MEEAGVAERIGVVVITRNESANIGPCLDSVAFCEERVVVDSFSDDDTVERACAKAEHVYRREFIHHAEQKNWAVGQLDTEWVLVVDADERVTGELAEEIRRIVQGGEHDGWWVYRRNAFFGRFIRGAGWNRDRVLRLYRRDRGRYDDRFVHEEVSLDAGSTAGSCEHRLLHFSYTDWDSTFERLLSYSRSGARERARRGHRGSVGAVLLKPPGRFFRQYVLGAGWRDGLHGLVLCQWSALGVFLREARLLLGEFGNEDVNRGPIRNPRVECVQGRAVREPSRAGGHDQAPVED